MKKLLIFISLLIWFNTFSYEELKVILGDRKCKISLKNLGMIEMDCETFKYIIDTSIKIRTMSITEMK